ncbi:hypothetical protein RvY_06705 [Ramazzottius varieornatus]|uniref:Uncharacterized protein n=1 Tax=Ramazzottius varieornatus TaxID=947166 RepID=A0A1D1UZJ0_RAMVA|nr:hypothetical protein RvY_06705 [Ramazzottius varieornatus]
MVVMDESYNSSVTADFRHSIIRHLSHSAPKIPVAALVIIFAIFLTIIVAFILFWVLNWMRSYKTFPSDEPTEYFLHDLWEERYLPSPLNHKLPPQKYACAQCELVSDDLKVMNYGNSEFDTRLLPHEDVLEKGESKISHGHMVRPSGRQEGIQARK